MKRKNASQPKGYYHHTDRAKGHQLRSDFFGIREAFHTEEQAFTFGHALAADKTMLISIRKRGILKHTTDFKTRIPSLEDWKTIQAECLEAGHKFSTVVHNKLEFLKGANTGDLNPLTVTLAKATQLVIDGRKQGNMFRYRDEWLGPIKSGHLPQYNHWLKDSALSNVPVRDITAVMMRKAIDDEVKTMKVKMAQPHRGVKKGDIISVSTIGIYIRVLMGILARYKSKFDPELPLLARGGGVEMMQNSKKEVTKKATPKLTHDECRLMIQLGDDEDGRRNAAEQPEWAFFGAFLRVTYCTGIRRLFMTKLTWGDVIDLDGDFPHIHKEMKSGVDATVPLLPMAVNALRLIRRQGFDRKNDLVFPKMDGTVYASVSIKFSPLVRDKLIDTGLIQHTPNPFHSLRAARATWLVKVCKFGLAEVCEWLNCSMATAKRYVDPQALIDRKQEILEIAKQYAAEEEDIPMPLYEVGTQ